MKPHTILLAVGLCVLAACGGGDKEVGEFKNDWVGNEIKIKSLTDPKVEGVICHLSYFDRGFWDRVGKGNWFENPSNSSISCLQTGPVTIHGIDLDKSGEEVFDQNQSLIFKQLAVRRIYDGDSDSLMYVSFSRKITNGSAKMSLSTVPLYGHEVTWDGGKPTE
ncbi:CreA family protein [Hyphomonas johnsonii]|uniref:Crea protein n=1 Tax=Hyphomonas johnsonii MHS-2 TaxID=1280950 RepID=A0A059FPF3_9PROT|nr:CreA family protein [Hyphomonas johnsonii]KCZ92358.1 crea protein [Hyphomonas johnsonii MHS-2]